MEPITRTTSGAREDQLVLVVEDSVLVAMAIEDALIERGVKVLVASTVAAAEQIAEVHAPSVALLDLQLPDGFTLDLACRLRDEGCAVAITSALDSGAVPDSHRFAVQFRKPTSPDLLADWVVATLQASHSDACTRNDFLLFPVGNRMTV
jgi:DNA-binding response OmpR family regulator